MPRVRWEYLDEFPKYVVSDHGEVVNIKSQRPVSMWVGRGGYYYVHIANEWYSQVLAVHTLVALLFLPGYQYGMHVGHLDKDTLNNHISNLYLKSREYNHGPDRSYNNIRGKAVLIVETGEVFVNAYAAAKHIRGNASNIYHCLSGRNKTHRGYHFEYVEDEDG